MGHSLLATGPILYRNVDRLGAITNVCVCKTAQEQAMTGWSARGRAESTRLVATVESAAFQVAADQLKGQRRGMVLEPTKVSPSLRMICMLCVNLTM